MVKRTDIASSAIHLTADAQFAQHYWPRMSKIEFNSVLRDAMYFEIRAGQYRVGGRLVSAPD